MSVKMGADSFYMSFEQVPKGTMLVGIDVSHASKDHSIVGFCASYNSNLSHYYSDIIKQKRGQEIVDNNLSKVFSDALTCYKNHNDQLPSHIIIYRDGVGDSQRQEVLQKEVNQFHEAIEALYNKTTVQPTITLVIVNKRINQKFFLQKGKNLDNPWSGTLIDTTVVERQDCNTEYDFFLIPQNTTQGCVTPTHFYVAYDNSPIKKDVLEKLTFDLCYYYFNW